MADVKDILGLSKLQANGAAGEKKKAVKEGQKKPDGISREVYALTGGLPPIVSGTDLSSFQKKNLKPKKVHWLWQPFPSSARTDSLQLRHWVKVADDVVPTGDYAFAKYNKAVQMVRYNEDEYTAYCTDPNWAKEETDHLFSLCNDFDLRFVVIADRYQNDGPWPSRTVEELKDRYYRIARKLTLVRAPKEDLSDNILVKDPYQASHESERKAALAALLRVSRSREAEEAATLAEARRILEERRAAGMAAPEGGPVRAAAPVEAPTAGAPPAHAHPAAAPPRVYLRSLKLQQSVTAALNTYGVRHSKRLDQMLLELGLAKPRVPTKAVCAEHLALRKDVLTLFGLQKRVQWKENEVAILRENPNAEPRAHRGADGERVATRSAPTPEGAEAERASKRSDKRKVPARFMEAPPSPPKRSRKLKVLDD